MDYRASKEWALILGGSSGFGLASAEALASIGMNLFIVHRDRRAALEGIERQFESLRQKGVAVHSFNTNALDSAGRESVLTQIADLLGDSKIKVLLHSIALGNLKLIVAEPKNHDLERQDTLRALSSLLKVDESTLSQGINTLFAQGLSNLSELAEAPQYNQESLIGEDDMAATIYNMGTSLLTWVQDLHRRRMFSSDARVLGLTSEGNEVAWRGYAAVSAAKVSLEAVARAIAREFAPYGIRCNILQPGVTETKALELIPGAAHLKAAAKRRNPFGRLTTPQDVGQVVALLARPEAQWINGALIRVDGGEHICG